MKKSQVNKYLYKEPKGYELPDSTSKELTKPMVDQMRETLKSSTALVTFRVGLHTEGPFKGLFTLEVRENNSWTPKLDGDLVEQILQDMGRLISETVEDNGKYKRQVWQ